MTMAMRSLIVAVGVAAASRGARACKPLGQAPHTIVASMQATDMTPPTLAAVPPARIHYADDAQGGCGSDCSDVGSIAIAPMATDDMTAPAQIGYRFTLQSGTLAPGLTLPATALDANSPEGVVLYWNSTTGQPFDFTLEIVAVDLAGNESAPQSLRIMNDSSHACAVGRGQRAGVASIVMLAVLFAAAARRRRSRA